MSATTTATPAAPGGEPEITINLRRVALQALAGLLVLVAAMATAGYFFREPLVAFSRTFVEQAGGPAILLGFLIPDATNIPIPHDAFSAFGLLGGLPFWTIVAWAGAGSLLGGTLGYLGARLLRRTRRLQAVLAHRGARIQAIMHRYGDVALALAALSPIPYSIGCWTCGALGMPLGRFLLISLLRVPRVAFYLWLIQVGFVSVS